MQEQNEGMQATHEAPVEPEVLPGPSVRSTVVGILIIGFVVLGLGFWVDGQRGEGIASESRAGAPQILLIEPAPGAVVGAPLDILFEVPARMRAGPAGWQAGNLHIHAAVDGIELMPSARDIEQVGGDRYRWTISSLRPGSHTLQLYWSGPDHRRIEEGASEVVPLEVR